MSWLVVSYHPGFAWDLTSWSTTIERKGKLIQRVDHFPSRRTIEHRIKLSWEQIMEIEMLIDALDLDSLRPAGRPRSITEGSGSIGARIKTAGVVKGFALPLLEWEWHVARGEFDRVPDWDFTPFLAFWRAVDAVSPHRFSGASSKEVEADPGVAGESDEQSDTSTSPDEPKR